MKKRTLAIIGLTLAILTISIVSACSYFHVLPINGIGYYTKQKEDSKVIIANVTEHITCNNGMLHLEFDVVNTDGTVKKVELWVYFKDGAGNGGNVLLEKYFLIGDMAARQTIHKSIDVLFTPSSLLDQLDSEEFSIHYER